MERQREARNTTFYLKLKDLDRFRPCDLSRSFRNQYFQKFPSGPTSCCRSHWSKSWSIIFFHRKSFPFKVFKISSLGGFCDAAILSIQNYIYSLQVGEVAAHDSATESSLIKRSKAIQAHLQQGSIACCILVGTYILQLNRNNHFSAGLSTSI